MEGSGLEAAGAVETTQLVFLQIAQLVHAGRGYIKVEDKPAGVVSSDHGVIVPVHCGDQG